VRVSKGGPQIRRLPTLRDASLRDAPQGEVVLVRAINEVVGGEMFDHEMRDAAERVLHACRKRGLKLVTAESCTGGLVAATLTAIAGSSDVVERAYVTYANEAKREMLGVPWDALMGHGAVSDPVARAMAAGALTRSGVDLAVSVTGVAGPGGGTPDKPVGLVHFAGARAGHDIVAERHVFPGDRDTIRRVAVITALTILASLAER